MPPLADPDLLTKLAALRAMQASGESPRVAELLLVEWPDPDGPVYYATRAAFDLLDSEALLAWLDGPIESRLGAGIFLDVTHDAGISDDVVELDFWDGDNEFTRLAQTHGPGVRVEVFYYFPDVDLLLSEWWGHLQPPQALDLERYKTTAQSGFRSSNLPLPSRAFFPSCSWVFGGLLETQAEIDANDCPYSRHLAGTRGAGSFASDTTWKQSLSAPEGWRELAFDDSGWSAAVDQGALDTYPWNYYGVVPFPPDSDAHWIWNHDSRASFDSNTVYFRRAFTAAAASALLVIAGDNSFTAWLNGQQVLLGSDWQDPRTVLLDLEIGESYVLAVEVVNVGNTPGGLAAELAYGLQGLGRGNLDPDTDEPFTDCPRNSRQACTARLGDARSFGGFGTVIETVLPPQGPNQLTTSRGNETNLKRPLRVIAGKRHVADLDLLAFAVQVNTPHPERGSAKFLFGVSEGRVKSNTNLKINNTTIAPQHANYTRGERRQAATSFSPDVNNYSGTVLSLGVMQGDFSQVSADQVNAECDIEGGDDVRVYSDETTFSEQYTNERGWWLLRALTDKRWGYGLDAARAMISDFIRIGIWFNEIVSVKDKAGVVFTGPRSRFNAELIDKTAQQQISDICSSGRLGLPFPHRGKLRVVELRRAPEIFSVLVFTDKAFFGAYDRAPTTEEREEWFEALLDARETSQAALLAEGQSRLLGLFTSADYVARARTDAEFIDDLYAGYLRRLADPGGHAFWLFQLQSATRAEIATAFGESQEFADDCSDSDVPTFSDRGADRNICVNEDRRSTLTFAQLSDADIANRIVLTYDDEQKENKQIPLVFESVEQQLLAGKAFGDTSRRAVEKQYTAFGVTDSGEAGRLGNLLLDLGEFDEGGVQNNLRATFVTWYLFALDLHKYQVIKIDAAKLDVINEVRAEQDKEPFTHFRVRSIKRLPNLKVEISVQAYPVSYYERLEMLSEGPPLTPGGDCPPGFHRDVDSGLCVPDSLPEDPPACFSANVRVRTPDGPVSFCDLSWRKPGCIVIRNLTGDHHAELIAHPNYEGMMIDMATREYVTLDHAMKAGDGWVPAAVHYDGLPRFLYRGTVYNLHVLSDKPEDHHYVLANGDVAHNEKITPFRVGIASATHTTDAIQFVIGTEAV